MKSSISDVLAREILDCRGNPTLQVDVIVDSEVLGRADVPAGLSTGVNEAKEKRDGGSRFHGLGVKDVANRVKEDILPAIKGMPVIEQRRIDNKMIALDGTSDKSNLGANVILGVSLAAARAASKILNMPLYRYLNINAHLLPVPLLNLINGGKHASNDLEFQEFCIFPIGAASFSHAMEMGYEVTRALEKIIVSKYGKIAVNVGDEGGFAPPITRVGEAMDCLVEAVEKAGYTRQIVFGLDCAASHIYDKKTKKYRLDRDDLTSGEMVSFYKELLQSYPIVTIEDPLSEEDVDGFVNLTRELGIQIVGDDFFCTNPALLKKYIPLKAGNSLLWKVNQIGTLTEALHAAELAFRSNYSVMVSERSGETEDPIIADLAVGINAGQIKTGAITRSERVAKYNRLLQIEEELGENGVYAGENYKLPF